MIDAPCSGLGILRRLPEGKHSKTLNHILELKTLQIKLLDHAFTLLKPGGTLVYSVCTFTSEETDQVIEAILKKHPSLHLELFQGGIFKTFPAVGGMDGFTIARFQKS